MGDYPPTFQTYSEVDVVVNSSNKTFPVPMQTERRLLWVWVKLITTIDAGDRQMVLQVEDAAGAVLGQFSRAGAVQAAGLTRYYLFGLGAENMAAFVDTDYLTVNLPNVTLFGGQVLRVFDKSAVAPVADDMEVTLQYAARAI